MGLETAVLHRNDHVWCPGGSGQALSHNPCLYIFFIPAAQECGGCNTAHPFMCVLFLNGEHVSHRGGHISRVMGASTSLGRPEFDISRGVFERTRPTANCMCSRGILPPGLGHVITAGGAVLPGDPAARAGTCDHRRWSRAPGGSCRPGWDM
eukprot:gene13968-biopygen5073